VLNRPQVKNALDLPAMDALRDVVSKVAADKEVRAVIFTGAGEEAFCSGGDLKQLQELRTFQDGEAMSLKMQHALHALENLDVPVIAHINGYAMGGGLDLVLACDMRIAHPHAIFGHRGAALGLITGWGGTQRLPRVVGRAKALEMFIAAEKLTAAKALEAGLINEISHDPVARAVELLRR
jgi:enoyl-CoA hydratase